MTKKEAKEKRISDILDAAVAEFVEKGYENTSMDSIAARAGLTKGGLYYHFAGKDDVLIRANERFMEPVLAMMDEAAKKALASEALGGYITRYLAYWSGHVQELSFIFLSMAKALSDPALGGMYRGYTSPMISFLESLYRRGIDSGEFKSVDPAAAAVALMAALDGIIGYLVMDTDLPLKETTARFVDIFVDRYREDSHERKTR